MILTTPLEWGDRPSSNFHLGHSIKSGTRKTPRRKRQRRSRPRFLTLSRC